MADIMRNDDNPDWSEFNPAPLDYAAKLKARRALLSMPQDGFSAPLHIPRSTLQNWERNRLTAHWKLKAFSPAASTDAHGLDAHGFRAAFGDCCDTPLDRSADGNGLRMACPDFMPHHSISTSKPEACTLLA